MAEMSVYYIPDNQEEYFSKQEEIADRFWKIGVFLHTPNQHIYDRMKEYKNNGLPLPKWNHGFSYSGMGIADEGFEVCIPTEVCDVTCPKCSGEISKQFMICVEDKRKVFHFHIENWSVRIAMKASGQLMFAHQQLTFDLLEFICGYLILATKIGSQTLNPQLSQFWGHAVRSFLGRRSCITIRAIRNHKWLLGRRYAAPMRSTLYGSKNGNIA